VRVEAIAGRNRCIRVTSSAGRGHFLKQADPADGSTAATVAHEASIYGYARGSESPPALRELFPALIAYDAPRRLLTLELVPDACNAHELDEAEGATPYPRIGALLGAALGVCHGTSGAITEGIEALGAPWVLELTRPTPSALRDLSAAQVELVKRVQSVPDVDAALVALRETWSATALIHGDLKWGNVLVRASAPAFEPERLWLIDWEFGSRGDPAWDIGSAFHGFLADRIHVVTHEDGTSAAAAREAFGAALPGAQEQHRLLWDAYVRTLGLSRAEALERLGRSTRCAGARLLQSAYEWSHGAWHPPRNAVVALQLAINLLRADTGAASRMLGFPADAVAVAR
jgi:Phosphotransferase enzyme family